MTEKQFEELTNLYLDNEIGRHELGELKDAIRHNVLRRRKFEHACELHQAARKALAARVDAAPGSPAEGVARSRAATLIPSSNPTAATASRPGPGSGGSISSNRPSTVRQKQTQAHRNASVATLAERQLSRGAASGVDLEKIKLGSRRREIVDGDPQNFSFFDSPVGMLMGAFFTALAALGLFFMVKISSSDENEDGTIKDATPIIARSDVAIDQKVLQQLAANQKGATAPDDVAHAHIYQSAMTGQPASNIPTSSDSASPALPLSAAPSTANLTLSAFPGVGSANVTPESVMNNEAAGGGLAPGADLWVKLSLPTLVPSAPTLDDGSKPANSSALPVALP